MLFNKNRFIILGEIETQTHSFLLTASFKLQFLSVSLHSHLTSTK